jgi:electron transfer flavoprotein alpha subunit
MHVDGLPAMSACSVIVVRDGVLPAGADEAFSVADRRAVIVGTGTEHAATGLSGPGAVSLVERAGSLSMMAAALGTVQQVCAAELIVIPASPDGRDLAPVLATLLDRPLLTGCTRVRRIGALMEVTLVRSDGLVDHVMSVDGPAVVTLIPGLTGIAGASGVIKVDRIRVPEAADSGNGVVSVDLLPPDPSTMDLTEAVCIVAGGQGLGSKERFDQLARFGVAIGGSLGGTRVASDAGWIPFERQIGTTGVAVNPRVYLAFAISGATQHTSGLGSPDHIISVNTDSSCPMMTMSEVAIVSDANAVLDALERKLGPSADAQHEATRSA